MLRVLICIVFLQVKGLHPELTAVANASKHEKLLLTPKQV